MQTKKEGKEMKSNKSNNPLTSAEQNLRRVAEDRLKTQQPAVQSERTDDESMRQLHELQVHQIELEMQNEELIRSRAKIEEMAARYTDLYDFAPVGYMTLDRNSVITQTNLVGASLLGLIGVQLIGHRFNAFVADADLVTSKAFFLRVFETTVKQICELNLVRKGQSPLIVQIEAISFADGQECQVTLMDITARK